MNINDKIFIFCKKILEDYGFEIILIDLTKGNDSYRKTLYINNFYLICKNKNNAFITAEATSYNCLYLIKKFFEPVLIKS